MASEVSFGMMGKISTFFIVILMTLIFSSITMSNEQGNTLQRPEYTPIGDIWKDVQRYQNRIISVSGHYRGWHGKKLKNPFITRSDWVIQDSTGAIYVTGRTPAISGKKVSLGTKIIVTGQVLLSEDNVPYIKAKKVLLEK